MALTVNDSFILMYLLIMNSRWRC